MNPTSNLPIGLKKYEVVLPSRAAWVFAALKSLNTNAKDSIILRDALHIYESVVYDYQKRKYLFVSRNGERPWALNISNVGDLLELPPEADTECPQSKVFFFSEHSALKLERLTRLIGAEDAPVTIVHAFFFTYDLLGRVLRNEQFFRRNSETSQFENVKFSLTAIRKS